MSYNLSVRTRPDVSEQQRQAGELVKRLRKLRWIGMDDEAENLEFSLRRLACREVVLVEAPDTD